MLEAPLFAFLGAFVLNLAITPYVIRRLRRSAILDIPNERSSHETPIPRGGGLVIVFTWVLGMLATWAIRFPFPALGILAPDGFVVAATIGIVGLAVLGFADDRLDLNPFLKLFVQIIVGVMAMWLSGLRVTDLGLPLTGAYDLGWWDSRIFSTSWTASMAWLSPS
jgi:Fuc2NAc and GlcNAc transferase